MLAALWLAAAAPAALPALQVLERQDCTADCRFEAVVIEGSKFDPGSKVAVVAADGKPACLLNPLAIVVKAAGKPQPMVGVPSSIALKQGETQRRVPVFLLVDEQPARQRVLKGQLCAASFDDTVFADAWQPADPVRIWQSGKADVADDGGTMFSGLLSGITAVERRNGSGNGGTVQAASKGGAVPKGGVATSYDSFSLRGAAAALEQAYAGLKKAVPSGSALSPSQWLFKRDSAATLQLLLRSVPKGARVLLGTTDLGLATETPIAVDRANFDAIVLASGKVRRPIKACKVTPLASATADALVECDLKGQ